MILHSWPGPNVLRSQQPRIRSHAEHTSAVNDGADPAWRLLILVVVVLSEHRDLPPRLAAAN